MIMEIGKVSIQEMEPWQYFNSPLTISSVSHFRKLVHALVQAPWSKIAERML
jgi:hypothetical protein